MSSVEPSGFGDMLRRYRAAAGLTQAELAERAGLSARGVQDLERGVRRTPRSETVRRLAAALGIGETQRVELQVASHRVDPARRGSMDQLADGLPVSLTSFVGRESELAELKVRLEHSRLLTLTGVGGVGKTRLAVEAARAVHNHYPGGVWLVEFCPVADPGLVPQYAAGVLRVHEKPGQSTLEALTARLRTRRTLLLLDNCEHLLYACARLVDVLMRNCPDLHVLATSREALGLPGEQAWRVPSLRGPDPGRPPPLAELHAYPAVQLFVARAADARPTFVLNERTALAVVQICARLDGIPLALELAAARVGALSVDQILARLDRRFQLLTGGSRAALPRQQTLRATIDWSYELLSTSERRLLSRLVVFSGGWSLEAAEVVCGGNGLDRESLLDVLVRLVSKSLVLVEDGPEGTSRYSLLETVRQYARERLVAENDVEVLYLAHAQYFLNWIEGLDLENFLHVGSLDVAVLNRLETDQDNLRGALRWWIDTGDAARAVQQAEVLLPIWYLSGSLTEGCTWLAELLAMSDRFETRSTRERALLMYASLARRHGDCELALEKFDELRSLRRATGDNTVKPSPLWT